MIRYLIKKILNNINQLRFKNNAIFLGKVNLSSLNSKILLDESKKEDIILSSQCVIYGTIISQNGGRIELSENVQLGKNTIIGAVNSIKIGKGTVISNNVMIIDNNNHPINPEDRIQMQNSPVGSDLRKWKNSVSKPIVIGENVWIGQFARINKGVTVGNNSIIGANSVVTKNVPEYAIAAGNPARIVKENIQNEPRLIF